MAVLLFVSSGVWDKWNHTTDLSQSMCQRIDALCEHLRSAAVFWCKLLGHAGKPCARKKNHFCLNNSIHSASDKMLDHGPVTILASMRNQTSFACLNNKFAVALKASSSVARSPTYRLLLMVTVITHLPASAASITFTSATGLNTKLSSTSTHRYVTVGSIPFS